MAVVKVLAMAFVLVVASFVATSFGTRAGNHFQSSLGGGEGCVERVPSGHQSDVQL
jgi:hypothetical protein